MGAQRDHPTALVLAAPAIGVLARALGCRLHELEEGAALKLQLPDVTLVTIDHAAHALTRRALHKCLALADFADVVVCSDQDILPGARWVRTKADSSMAANMVLWEELPKHIRSSHFLYAHWDSWVINPAAWSDTFLDYDYIGAPWIHRHPPYNVGNGGFSLRGRNMANYIRNKFPFYNPEDYGICVYYRAVLEDQGFCWPRDKIAAQFAAETQWPQDFLPFGFHGASNFPMVMSPEEYDEVVALATPYILNSEIWSHLQALFDFIRQGHPRPDWCAPFQPGWDKRLGEMAL